MRAVIFGGIGTLVETSEIQRQAFNQAFAEAGLLWHWDLPQYRRLLSVAGGLNRLRHFAASRAGEALGDDELVALHQRKNELFREALARGGLTPRAGVRRLITKAKGADMLVALASTNVRSNIFSVVDAGYLDLADFDVILHRGDVEHRKPHPEIYQRCLSVLGVAAQDAVAIEDSDSGVASAIAAGLHCIALSRDHSAEQALATATLAIDRDVPARGQQLRASAFHAPGMNGMDLGLVQQLVADIR